MTNELELIGKSCNKIRQYASIDRIDVFRDLDLSRINSSKLTNQQIDDIIFRLIKEIQALNKYTHTSQIKFI